MLRFLIDRPRIALTACFLLAQCTAALAQRDFAPALVISAVPETSAEAMNSGAMMAEYQNPREICRPKIQAVIECSRIAAGRPTAARMPLRRSSRCASARDVPVPSARE